MTSGAKITIALISAAGVGLIVYLLTKKSSTSTMTAQQIALAQQRAAQAKLQQQQSYNNQASNQIASQISGTLLQTLGKKLDSLINPKPTPTTTVPKPSTSTGGYTSGGTTTSGSGYSQNPPTDFSTLGNNFYVLADGSFYDNTGQLYDPTGMPVFNDTGYTSSTNTGTTTPVDASQINDWGAYAYDNGDGTYSDNYGNTFDSSTGQFLY